MRAYVVIFVESSLTEVNERNNGARQCGRSDGSGSRARARTRLKTFTEE